MSKKFVRRVSFRHSKLGKGRKKKQVWRRPTGRDNKMREQRKGRPPVVKIGYRNSDRKNLKVIRSARDIEGIQKDQKVVLGNIGGKKKADIVKKLNEMKIEIVNLNMKRFLKHMSVQETKKSAKKVPEKGKGAKK